MSRFLSQQLSDWVLNCRFDAIPAGVVTKTEDCILDAISSATAGNRALGASIIHSVARRHFQGGAAGIWFAPTKIGSVGAAFVNSAKTSFLDIDDGNRLAMGHPGAAVVPTVVAAAQELGTSGQDILTAVIAGYQVGIALAVAECRKSYHSGNWTTFAVAAALGRLRGQSVDELSHALAISAYHGPRCLDLTLSDVMGAHVKESIPWSVVAGMMASDLASEGFTGCLDIFDVEGRFDTAQSVRTLNDGFAVQKTYFKRFSCCRWIHAPVEAALKIMETQDIDINDISSVHVETFRQSVDLENRADPLTLESAQYSVPFCIALALVDGAEALTPLEMTSLNRDAIETLASRVSLSVDQEIQSMFPEKAGARVSIHTDQRVFSDTVLVP